MSAEPASRKVTSVEEAERDLAANKQPATKTIVKNGEAIMRVKVYSPFRTYFDREAFSVSGENQTGPFDILPHHHNFITLLDAGELVIRTSEAEQKIRISGGIMHVKADQVIVFLDV